MEQKIKVVGAKENNLKNVSVEIPRNKLVVFTGVSGSGKSSLAFNTIFAEGQRRFVESLSSYARQFLGGVKKPDVENIEGLSPSISIDQKTTNHNPRSTVGTVTEIYDYLRLLFARVGDAYCPNCNKPIKSQTTQEIVESIMTIGQGEKILLLAPIARGQKGTFAKNFESLKKSGYVRVIVDGNMWELNDDIVLDKNIKHNIEVVVDRLIIKENIEARVAESVENCFKLSDGLVIVSHNDNQVLMSNKHSCPNCGFSLEEISPRVFSFNNPYGACPNCSGLGFINDIDVSRVLKNSHLSISGGAFNLTGWNYETGAMAKMYFDALAQRYDIDLNCPVKELPKDKLDLILFGNNGEKIDMSMQSGKFTGQFKNSFEGLVNNLKRRYDESKSEFVRFEIGRFMCEQPCPVCHGKRLNQNALSVKIEGLDIWQMCQKSVEDLISFFENVKFSKTKQDIAESILKEILARLNFLKNVGLEYLTLARSAETLSGGESQRIRLATQIGSGLVGVLYILDEPSIGLHQRDNDRLLDTLFHLRDLGNSLIVVEHDEDTIKSADFIVDVGPYAGVHGGEIVASGTVEDIKKCKNSITGKFLSGEEKIEIPNERINPSGFLSIKGANENNLKNINVNIPLGVLTVVTGVSGSGKSSLVNGIIYPYLSGKINGRTFNKINFKSFVGDEQIDKVILIDQSPIGRTPRSNPATYTGVFTPIRELFASTQPAKQRGYTSGRFSFNIRGGRCETCEGAGEKEIEMYFLPDISIPCEVCHGARYNKETLQVVYKDKNISDVLEMTVEEALKFFENIPTIRNRLQALFDVGLGYIKLGQSATTLSGGEAQRVKLASELARKSTGKTLYILDEPTTGLHSYDVKKLIGILQRLKANGNSILVIEHNLDVIKCADYIIDLGPEGGDRGGEIVATGTPEQVAQCEKSYTGKYLKKILNSNKK